MYKRSKAGWIVQPYFKVSGVLYTCIGSGRWRSLWGGGLKKKIKSLIINP